MQPLVVITDLKEAVGLLIKALGRPGVDPTTATVAQLISLETNFNGQLEKQLEIHLETKLIGIRRSLAKIVYGSVEEHCAAIADKLLEHFNKGYLAPSQGKKSNATSAKKKAYDAGSYVMALEDFCFLQATYDLLAGKLHRLDPVIGDMGCQWRVPFVLDAQENLLEALRQMFGWPMQDAPGEIERMVQDYEKAVALLLQQPDFERFLNFESYCTQYGDTLALIKDDDSRDSAWQKGNKQTRGERPTRICPYATKLIYLEAMDTSLQGLMDEIRKIAPFFAKALTISVDFFATWKKEEFSLSARDYLVCCKLITYRTKRRVDCFGLSSVPLEIFLPLDDKTIQNKYKALATCSWDYMDYVSRYVCEISGNKVHWTGNETDGWDYKYEGNNDSLCVSIHKCLQIGYQTSQAGASYFTHLFFAPLRLIFMYQHAKNQPIIIDHRRLKCRVLPNTITYVNPENDQQSETFNDAEYSLVGSDIFYFEPTSNGGFTYVPNPSAIQRKKVGMCVETFSVIAEGDVTVYAPGDLAFKSDDWNVYSTVLQNAPIVNLIMTAAALHPELPGNTKINGLVTPPLPEAERVYNACTLAPCQTPTIYLQSLCGPSIPLGGGVLTSSWDIWSEKTCCMNLLTSLNATNTEYRHVLPGRQVGRRLASTIPFGAIHIYGCTFEVKVLEMQSLLGNPVQRQRREEGVNRLMTQDRDTDRPK